MGCSVDNGVWMAYTGLLFEKFFGPGVLTPLEDTDDCFELKVDHLNLTTKMIKAVNWLGQVVQEIQPKVKVCDCQYTRVEFWTWFLGGL